MSKEQSQDQVSFKDTLNLPRTDFPIRPNAAIDDPKMIEYWEKIDLYRTTFDSNHGKKKFILHDGPPYANGNIHLGHAYNKIIKDIIAKSKRMAGFHVPVTPGWDCHGLPIEFKVTQENLGIAPEQVKPACRAYAQKWIDIQRDEFKRLGVLMDWQRPYLTMDKGYEANIIRAFGLLVSGGYIQRKNKTVPWCFHCQTVLATAEIEYQDRKDPSIYVLFPLTQESRQELFPDHAGREISLLIWTTTPWTLPLNRAVFVNPKTTYDLLEGKDTLFIVGSTVADAVCKAIGIEKKVVATISGQDLGQWKAHHPFINDLVVPVLADQFVSLEDGTACVHSAPGCGPEDYDMGVKYGLEIFSPLSADGKYTYGIQPAELLNMSITDGQIWVIKTLAAHNKLFFKTSIRHSFPQCWRCHNGLMFRATPQWFCNLNNDGLKERVLKAIDTINFIPERSVNFLRATISNRLEWCLSRQRLWGTPIPALICKNGDSAFIDNQLIEKVAQGVEKEGIEYWDKVSADELIWPSVKCTECGSTEFVKEKDILDVWFESGVSHFAVLKHDKQLAYPADLYAEGVDQHRGWFQSSLLTSLIIEQEPCFKSLITHGFTVDDQGRKMSKSIGNGVEPMQVIDQLGTDGLRLWASSISFEGDAVMSDALLNNVKEVYRKIRNSSRFLLSNLYDFNNEHDKVEYTQLQAIDQYALSQLAIINNNILSAYQKYDLTAVFHELGSYCADLSSLYLDIAKDRLYVEKADGILRRSAQTVCWYILDTLTHISAPVLSFTAEQLSDYYQPNKKQSIHLSLFPELPTAFSFSQEKNAQWKKILEVRSAILKAIEVEREKGVIKHSLEARVSCYIDNTEKELSDVTKFLQNLSEMGQSEIEFFKKFLIVSQFEFEKGHEELLPTSIKGLWVKVEHARGNKCPRCWNWDITDDPNYLDARCQRVLKR